MAKEIVFDSLAGLFIKQPLRYFVRTCITLGDARLRRHDESLQLCNASANFCYVYLITRSAELEVPQSEQSEDAFRALGLPYKRHRHTAVHIQHIAG